MTGGRSYGSGDDARRDADPRRHPVPPLWRPAIADWVTYMRAGGASPATVRTRRDALEALARHIQITHPWLVSTEQLVNFVGSKQWANSTRASKRVSYRMFYQWAVRTGRTEVNPAEDMPHIRSIAASPRPAPFDVFLAAYGRASSIGRIILRLGFELGLRRAEIAAIHHRDIVTTNQGIEVWVHGKGSKSRLIPLPPEMGEELSRLTQSRGGYLFPGEVNGHMSPERIGKIANSLLAKPWTLHTLRHACASGMLANGVNLRVIQEVLGHASVATTQVYTAVQGTALRTALEDRASRIAS